MKEEGIYKTYMLESGIGTIIRDNFMNYATFPSWYEVDNIKISNNKLYFLFMSQKKNNNLIEVNSNVLVDHSNLMWTHDNPSVINNSILGDITHPLYIIRDGRSVVNSIINYVTSPTAMMANPQYEITDKNDIFNNDELFGRYVKTWSEHVDGYLDNKNKYLLVQAEHLKSSVSEVAEEVCEYIGIDVDLTNIKDYVDYSLLLKQAPNHILTKKNKWQENFSKQNVEIFKDIAGDNLINMGYVTDNKW